MMDGEATAPTLGGEASPRFLRGTVSRVHGRKRRAIGADVETGGLNGAFIAGAFLVEGRDFQLFTDPALMFRTFLRSYPDHELLFHNADYDLRYFLPYLVALARTGNYRVSLALNPENRIIAITINKGHHNWYIRDTFALMPDALAELSGLAGMNKLDIGIATGTRFDVTNREHLDYLRRDCEMVYRAYRAYERTIRESFGVPTATTAATTALHGWQATQGHSRGYYRQRPEVEKAARAAFFGGLAFMTTNKQVRDVVALDINGMYAAAMRGGVPVKSGARTDREVEGYPALYRCRVHAPATVQFPFVPHRTRDLETVYVTGHFEGWYTSNTIALARERGYEFQVSEGYVFEEIEPIFTDFIDICEEVEAEYRTRGARSAIKYIRNALWGKFGQRPERREYHLTTDPTDDMTPVIGPNGELIDVLFTRTVEKQSAHMMPVWAAWITSEARNAYARGIYALGPNFCIYGDTDSVVVHKEALSAAMDTGAIDVGARYGQWRIVAEYQTFAAIRPKTYVGKLELGDYHIAHKGIRHGLVTPEDLETVVVTHAPLIVQMDTVPSALSTIWDMATDHVTQRTISPLKEGPQFEVDQKTGEIRKKHYTSW